MIRIKIALLLVMVMTVVSCSNDEADFQEPVNIGDYTLLIQSDNGKTSGADVYKSNETCNPPHCYVGEGAYYEGGMLVMVYSMSFFANLKGSDVFNMLNIGFDSNSPMSFSDLKAGDTFDTSQFHAEAYYTPTWQEDIMRGAKAESGKVTVVSMTTIDGKPCVTLKITNLQFAAIDNSCTYTINGTVDYEIYQYYELYQSFNE